MAEKSYVHAWEATKFAIQLEFDQQQQTWLDRLDQRIALVRELFAALIADGKYDQAVAAIPLATQIRRRQAALLEQEALVTEIEQLIRDARMLHHGLRDIEAWPLLQEAVAMRPMLQPPHLDRITVTLASQLIESAIVFHCSDRSAMAAEASAVAGSFHRELVQRGSGYCAHQLGMMLEEMPPALQRVAFATEPTNRKPATSSRAGEVPGHPDQCDNMVAVSNPSPGVRQRARILIVDDSALMLDLAKEALQSAGFEVDVAQVLSQIADEDKLRSFDLILIDVMMPELHGDDVAMILRGEIEGITAAIYLMSSLSDEELAERASEAGIDGYISKRDGIEALVARVDEILGRRRVAESQPARAGEHDQL